MPRGGFIRAPAATADARGRLCYLPEAMRQLAYTVVYEPQSDGGYTVHVPSLPGCITEGDTMEEARRMAQDAIRAYCESLLADGEPLPPNVVESPRLELLEFAL